MISPDDSKLSDSFLLRHYAEHGDAGAFDRLFARYRNLVYSACRSVLGNHESASDAVGATFLILSKRASRLSHRESLAGWLYETANLTARNVRRIEEGHVKKLRRLGEVLARENSGNPSPTLLEDSLALLKTADRKAVLLKYVQGFSYAEVGQTLNCSEDAARMRIKRALELLSQSIVASGIDPNLSDLERTLERISPNSGSARPWLTRQSIAISDSVQRLRHWRVAQATAGALTALTVVTFVPTRLHSGGAPVGKRPSLLKQTTSAPALLPYREQARVLGTATTFTLKYKASEKSQGSPDDLFTLTLSYDGQGLISERAKHDGSFETSLFRERNVTMIADSGYLPNAPGELGKVKITIISDRPMDPSEREWTAAKSSQAPPLTRYPMITNIPPVGFSLPNPYLNISLDGSYSWFMGGGLPTTRDAEGNITQFGAYDAKYSLSNYRLVGGLHVAGHIVVSRNMGDFQGPNTYDLISASISPLPESKFSVDSYRKGKLVVKTRTQGDWPNLTWFYVPSSTPDAVITKIRQLATTSH